MRVLALLKQVPDIVSDRRLDEAGRLVRDPDDAVLNEIDEGALETALRAADVLGGSVTAVTMGPASAEAVVRKALQVGAAHAVHLHDEAFAGSDAVGTARALAATVRMLDAEDGAEPVGLVVCGMTALDGLGGVVPALVAAGLRWPIVGCADAVDISAAEDADPAHAIVSRVTENGKEVLRADLPAVISVTDTIAPLRAPNFQTMLAARSAPIRTVTAADLDLGEDRVGGSGALARVIRSAERASRPAPIVVRADGARALVDFLAERDLLEVSR